MAKSISRWLPVFLVLASGAAGWSAAKLSPGPQKEESEAGKAVTEKARPLAKERSLSTLAPMKEFLAELSPAADDGKIWRIVQRLDPKYIPAALAEIAAREDSRNYERWMSALYYRWAETDPMAAIGSAKQLVGEHLQDSMALAVLSSWMAKDADAAYLALRNDKDFSHYARNMLVRTWNQETVFENLKRFPDEKDSQYLLGAYCYHSADDPASRDHMIAALAEKKDLPFRDWGYSLLYRSWLYQDPAKALAAVSEQPIPWLQQQMLKDGLSNQPAATLKWAAEKGLQPGESIWQNAYRNWLVFEPAEARGWFAEQMPVWSERGDHRAVADFISQDIDNTTATKDEATRQQLNEQLAKQIELWRQQDSAAADEWLAAAKKKAVNPSLQNR